MAKKLERNTFPTGHGPNDFKCFGPPALKDGEFHGTKICDMGCFMQEEVDSNKYYHGSIVQSNNNQQWYVYFEYGRVGAKNPSFQFVECSSPAEAENEYSKQLESKNIKRGTWENHAVLGKRLVPRIDSKGKPQDLYIVRPQHTRSTGLPAAKTITAGTDHLDQTKLKTNGNGKTKTKKKVTHNVDPQTTSLMRDLNVATVNYTQTQMADAALPTQHALNDARAILQEALRQISNIGDSINDQVNDRELKQLTRDIYGIIPKIKDRGAAPETWILSQNNILRWQQDIDAFESALYAVDISEIDTQENPMGDLPLTMEWISPKSDLGEFLYQWWPNATRNVHGHIGKLTPKNIWKLDRHGDARKLTDYQEKVTSTRWTTPERPLHQPKRIDLGRDEAKLYAKSGTYLLAHGSRSVNLTGIMRFSLRLPKQLVGVVITGSAFGCGVYFADDIKKSAGYTSLRGSYWSGGSGGIRGRGAFMFVADVCLGKPYVTPGSRPFTSAPSGHHSVFAKAGFSGVQNNEFITYDTDSLKLRYLVEFE